MDKNKCMTKVTRARVMFVRTMASRVTRARRVLSCLGLMLFLGIGTATAQNEGNVEKIASKNLVFGDLLPKDSLSQKSLPQNSVEGETPSLNLNSVGQESSSDDKNISDKVISEDFNKKVGISVFDKTSPSYNYKLYSNPLESVDWGFGKEKETPYTVKPLQMVIPASLFILGKIGQESDWFQSRNKEIRDELQEHIKSPFPIDDYTQYAPMVATYGLNLCGIRGQHGYGDLTIILGTAYALMGISVNSLKSATKVMRPDGSSRNSFPSGHTATAFMGAELLRREYKDVSPWIGVAGYAVAAGTGFFRMYNNRHWFTDVVAGAGIGIMSVEAAYWLYPVISKTFFRKRYLKNTFISPYLSEEGKGLACNITF